MGTPGERIELRRITGSACDLISSHPVTGSGTIEVPTDELHRGTYAVVLTDPAETIIAQAHVWLGDPDAGPRLTVPTTVRAGDPITVAWANAPGARWDWIGVYPAGADPLVDDWLLYRYTETRIQARLDIDDAAEGDAWPLAPGRYDIHYLLDDGYASLARATVTVTP
jgi:hypothetical protein